MLNSMPMPGDVVRLDGVLTGARRGSIGVLGGVLGRARDEYEVCFSASAFRNDQYVSCSGGPIPFVGAEDLIPTGEVLQQTFWRWKDGRSGAGRGEYYSLEVPVWSWNPNGYRARVERALDTYRFWAADGALWLPEVQAACRLLGYPVVERPFRDVRSSVPENAPPAIAEFAVWLCHRAGIGGVCDVAYICNVVALESGYGDGCGQFFSSHRDATQSDVERICARLLHSYGQSLRGKVTHADLAWHLATALSLVTVRL